MTSLCYKFSGNYIKFQNSVNFYGYNGKLKGEIICFNMHAGTDPGRKPCQIDAEELYNFRPKNRKGDS